MISKKMEKALNKQINLELYSAYIYAAMAADFDAKNLPGFAQWMKAQTQEEVAHAMKFYGYVNEAGGRVVLDAIEKPPASYASPLKAFEASLKHERVVTKSIYHLVDLAKEESDHATSVFLQWYVAEQVEEEAHADAILQRLKMVGEAGHGILMIDRELGQRQSAPAPGGEED
ncbi:MAG: ferritin [Candidatus Hydrogenedentes bacterium]|nr:ferritin [Candidatus Hydrogenedentota bacterium]